jgi:diacylglycerol kinase family enzyme
VDGYRHTRRRLLVFVNPVGGPGKALEIFTADVAPMFRHAQIDVELVGTSPVWAVFVNDCCPMSSHVPSCPAMSIACRVCAHTHSHTPLARSVTNYQNHAKETVEAFDLSTVEGIASVGGDGLLYEVGQTCRSCAPRVL